MEDIQTVVLVVHTLIALAIIALVLLQRGKGAEAGAAFGSGASGTVFGSRGTTSFFSRVTAILATAFFVTSLTLAYISSQRTTAPESLLEGAPAVEAEAPAEDVPSDLGDLPELPQIEEAPGDASNDAADAPEGNDAAGEEEAANEQ